MRHLFSGLTFIGFMAGFTADFAVASQSPSDSVLLDPPPHSQWGFTLADAKTGKLLEENNGREFMIPASVVKLLTTAFALDKFGESQKFTTVLYRTGKIKNGVLHGDLWIRGGGNPALGSERADSTQHAENVFKIFYQGLQRSGINKVDGNIYGDASLLKFEGPSRGALWEDIGNYYGTVPSGLCFHDNSYTLQLDTGTDRPLVVVSTTPKHIGISSFQITAKNSGALNGDSCFILGAFWNTPRLIVGKCAVGKQPLEIKGSLPDPAWTCARAFEDYLHEQGVVVKGLDVGRSSDPYPPMRHLPADTARLAEHASPPLINIITMVHAFSDNLYAAQLLAMSGGIDALQDWLARQNGEFQHTELSSELRLVDGNGLSLQNQITTEELTVLLSSFAGKPWFPIWRETLIGGATRPFRSTAYAEGLHGKLWVKTGSMNSVSSLAGYIEAKSGRILSFTIIINHFDEHSSALRNTWGPLLRAWADKY